LEATSLTQAAIGRILWTVVANVQERGHASTVIRESLTFEHLMMANFVAFEGSSGSFAI